MKQWFAVNCFLSAFLLVHSTAASPAPRKPVYPVFGILQTDPQLRGADSIPQTPEAFAPLHQYQMVYTRDSQALKAVRDGRKLAGCKTPVLVYMGGFTTNPGGATEIEKGYRQAVAMVDSTTLAEALDANAVQVRVRISKDGEFPIKASTAAVSDPNDKTKYCFWIRIDDELMNVLEAEAKTGLLRVQRGFESKVVSHSAGAKVLTPIYVGNREQLGALRHSNSWPDGPDYLRYALDPSSEAAQRFKAGLIIALMETGYDGAWLDTFQPVPFNLCDSLGRKVAYYWDFKTQRRYNFDSYTAALQAFLRGVRQKVKDSIGKEPILAANSISGSYAEGGKKLFLAPDRPGLLDGGYCFEDSYINMKGTKGKRGNMQAGFSPHATERWLRNVENEADAARDGLRALCMMGMAGYVAAYINPSLPNYDQLLRFSWCSFLLTVTKERTTWFGLPLLITKQGGKTGFLPLSGIFYAPVGDPVESNEIGQLKLPNTECYQRKFSNGLVLVRPAGTGDPALVDIPAGYIDWQSKEPVRQVRLAPGDARLLVKL